MIIVAMQRLHLDDLTGYLIRETTGWDQLELPAIATAPQNVPIARDAATAARSVKFCTQPSNPSLP